MSVKADINLLIGHYKNKINDCENKIKNANNYGDPFHPTYIRIYTVNNLLITEYEQFILELLGLIVSCRPIPPNGTVIYE